MKRVESGNRLLFVLAVILATVFVALVFNIATKKIIQHYWGIEIKKENLKLDNEFESERADLIKQNNDLDSQLN